MGAMEVGTQMPGDILLTRKVIYLMQAILIQLKQVIAQLLKLQDQPFTHLLIFLTVKTKLKLRNWLQKGLLLFASTQLVPSHTIKLVFLLALVLQDVTMLCPL